MSTDLDLPLLPSAEQIKRREFATVRRGYDPDQVRESLSQVAVQIEAMEHELRETRLTSAVGVSETEPAEDPYQKLADRFVEVLETADKKAEEILAEAGADAGRMVAEARADADRIRVDAQARAEEARQAGQEFLEKARLESERVLSNLTSKREALVAHLHEMQLKLRVVADDLGRAVLDPSAGAQDDHADPNVDRGTADADLELRSDDQSGPDEPDAPDAPDADPGLDPRYEDLWSSTEDLRLTDLFPEDEPD